MEPVSAEIKALLDGGLAALRQGDLPKAETLVTRALASAPNIAGAQDMMARIHLRQGRLPEAEKHARQAVALAENQPQFHDTRVRIALQNGSVEALLAEYEQDEAAPRGHTGNLYGAGMLLHELGRDEEALARFEQAREIAPGSVPIVRGAARVLIRLGRHVDAMAPINELFAAGQDGADLHAMAGVCLLALNNAQQAAVAMERALQRNDSMRVAHTGLSAAYLHSGRADEARAATTRFLKRFPSHTRDATNPEASILVLGHLTAGCFTRHYSGSEVFSHSNTIGQIPSRRVTFQHIYINHPDPVAAARSVGPVDAIFNDAANAEASGRTGATATVRAIVDALGVPVINAPEAVARTSREENARRIPAALDIVFPRTVRYALSGGETGPIAKAIGDDLSFPLLVRRIETHLDEHIHRADDPTGLRRALDYFSSIGANEVYAIEYRAEPFQPGIYRKIRCALIDGMFYPSNVVFSQNWNVHRLKAEMALMKASPELMEQEQAFLRDPADYIGAENIVRLEALARLLELEFLGVDFNVAANGDLVIFEANPAMHALQTMELDDFPYFADSCERFIAAFEEMLLLRKAR